MEESSGEDRKVKEREMEELPATARKVTSTGLRCRTLKLLAERKQESTASARGRARKGRHSAMKPSG